MTDITMTHDNIMVTDEDNSSKTESGLHLPEQYQGHVKYGTVVEVGTGGYSATGEPLPMEISIRDRVAYHVTKGIPVIIGGQKFRVMKDVDVLFIVS